MVHYKIEYKEGAWHIFMRGLLKYYQVDEKGFKTLEEANEEYNKIRGGSGILKIIQ